MVKRALLRWVVSSLAIVPVFAAACGGADDNTSSNQSDASVGDGAANDARAVDAGSDAAAPTALRLIAPLSTSRVTTKQPTLHWQLPSGVTDATIDLCSDRACTNPIGTPTHVTGSTFKPAADLPTGVVFWRVHPSTSTTIVSATWELNVGKISAPIDTSSGTTLDVNGDGYADVAISEPGFPSGTNVGKVEIFLGSAMGIVDESDGGANPATIVNGPDGPTGVFGIQVASAGDVNGDGFADLIVGADEVTSDAGAVGTGRAYVYLGGSSGLATAPSTVLNGIGTAQSYFAGSVASGGDVNGDGYADVIVGEEDANGSIGRAYIFLGSASGILATAATTLDGLDGANGDFGVAVSGAGDMNGDGYADVAVGAGGASSDAGIQVGKVYVYFGGKSGISTTPSATLVGPDGAQLEFGINLANGGDINGDGYSDLIVDTYDNVADTSAHIFLGSASGPAAAPSTTLTGIGYFSASTAGADVNGDGYSDLIVGAPDINTNTGQVSIVVGASSGIANFPVPSAFFPGPGGASGYFGEYVANAGDVNGDGYQDIVVGATGESSGAGAAYLYLGSATGISSTPTSTPKLAGEDGANTYFGNSVFGATN